jgi:hypothetical protein
VSERDRVLEPTLGTGGLRLEKERTRFGVSTDRLLSSGRRGMKKRNKKDKK